MLYKWIFSVVLPLISTQGCTIDNKFQIYYQGIDKPSSFYPEKFNEAKVIETTDMPKLLAEYEAKGYRVLGSSAFDGSWETRLKAAEFAKSIGASLVIASGELEESLPQADQIHVPTVNSSFQSGEIDLGYGNLAVFSATTTTHGTQQVSTVYYIGQYAQKAIFLTKDGHAE